MTSTRALSIAAVMVLVAISTIGCRSRMWHYQTADRMAQCLINEKSAAVPEGLPVDFSLVPPPESRLATEGCLACPTLPKTHVELYAYDLPLRGNRFESLDGETDSQDDDKEEDDSDIVGTPIPPAAWQSLPESCLKRMFDFQSIRDEAAFTKERLDSDPYISREGSAAPKLSLRDIVDLALLNSREYQTQKEALYLVSLQLAQERFAFTTKFSAGRNGAAAGIDNIRIDGTTLERSSIPTNLQIDRALVTGGDLLASFANNILLTFDGPTGFTADVGSSVLIEFVQPLIQTDIQFESLTQAERNLVYAARDFARFRKAFFVNFASQYYDLIASFRQIEIDSQNYFSLVRAFNQAEAEYSAGLQPRVQVDQVEQSLLNGRGRLIGTCNSVEQSLDRLNLAMGVPTETPINIDLEELNELTRIDQLSVSADSTNRVLRRLSSSLKKPDRSELASTAAVLLDRLIDSMELETQESSENEKLIEFKKLRGQFLIDYARIGADQIRSDLEEEIGSESPSTPVIFQRSIAYCNALVNLLQLQLDLADVGKEESSETAIAEYRDTAKEKASEIEGLRKKLLKLIEEEDISGLPLLVKESNEAQKGLLQLVGKLDDQFEIESSENPKVDLARIQTKVESLIADVTAKLQEAGMGLKPIDIDMDDAMITAIVLRYELMNERGFVADDWRGIKLAADELRSVLTLRASQRIDTAPGDNQPFNFDLDNSQTSLGLTFDSPLNRFAQRNSYRASIINYQRSLRNLKELEDNIKFSVRNDLRSLTLDREQYLIAVASAALAYERVVSTSLEFRLGTGGVSARDFLEAQTAYIDALSDVASRHIQYIVDRTQLFFNLELLMVDGEGFWNEVRNEALQPEPQFEIPAWGTPVYGDLPNVRYSSTVRQILQPVLTEFVQPNEIVQPNAIEESLLPFEEP